MILEIVAPPTPPPHPSASIYWSSPHKAPGEETNPKAMPVSMHAARSCLVFSDMWTSGWKVNAEWQQWLSQARPSSLAVSWNDQTLLWNFLFKKKKNFLQWIAQHCCVTFQSKLQELFKFYETASFLTLVAGLLYSEVDLVVFKVHLPSIIVTV